MTNLVSTLESTLESGILSYLVNALWQVPLLFAAAWVAARAIRPLGAAAEHRVWVGALLLQVLLPATSIVPWDLLRNFSLWTSAPLAGTQPHISVITGPGTAFGILQLPAWLLAGIAIAYAVVTAWFAAQFAWRLRRIHTLRRNATPITLTGDAALDWEHCVQTFVIPDAAVAVSSQIYGPATIGIARKLVLLPDSMLSTLPAPEMHAAISHEFAHMRRHDFLKNLIHELLSLPVRFHPLFRLTRQRVMETREMVCDQMAAEIGERHQYARSLLRLASLLVHGMPTRTPHAIGVFDATTFERRVMRLTQNQTPVSARRRFATAAANVLLAAAVCGSAIALSVRVDAFAADDKPGASPNGPVNVSAETMQNQIVSKVMPAYPVDAKKARIQGSVKLDAVIGKTGEVEQLKVITGPKELQQSSLDAVRQWTYKPFLLNGEPVDVKTTITVVYSLKK
jgi:TonB family protein